MILPCLVFGIILLFGSIVFIHGLLNEELEKSIVIPMFGFTILGTMLIMIFYTKSEPSALDVYRNETTLEITYRGNTAIDSCVAFKDGSKFKLRRE